MTTAHFPTLFFALLLSLVSLLVSPGIFSSGETAETLTKQQFSEVRRARDEFHRVFQGEHTISADSPSGTHIVTTGISNLPGPTASCPPPTQLNAVSQQCEITQDTTIAKALVLPSNTSLNCHDKALTPSHVGTRGTSPQPQVGIFLNNVHGVEIQHCHIENFDFGIYAINSKLSATEQSDPATLAALRNSIHNNTIFGRYIPISLQGVDDTEITTNTLTFIRVGGRGIVVERDSDLNTIQNNTITAQFEPLGIGPFNAPGPRLLQPLPSNPRLASGAGILLGQVGGAEPMLLTIILDGQIFQLPVKENPGTFDFTSGNKILSNRINIPFPLPASPPKFPDVTDGIALPVAQLTTIDENTITGAQFDIRVGVQSGSQGGTKMFPGQCSQNQTRLCLTSSDCFIPGFDDPNNNNGNCPQLKTTPVSWLSKGNVVEKNHITSSFLGGIIVAGERTTIKGNDITGPQRNGPAPLDSAQPGAISLVGGRALDTTTVTGNVVSNVNIALSLQSVFGDLVPSCSKFQTCLDPLTCLGAGISLNDFSGYNIAVQTDNSYNLLSALSVGDEGNFWGVQCLLPSKVQFRNKSANSFVKDCAAFGAPVARASTTKGVPTCQ